MEHTSRLVHSPLFEQLRHSLLEKIASGEWAPGMQVPSESELSREYRLSPGTVRKALDFLEDAKFILRQQGRGTFIMDPEGRETIRRFERFRSEDGALVGQTLEVLSHVEDEATDAERANLQIADGSCVRRIVRLRRFKGAPFLYEHIALPAAMLPTARDVDNPEFWIATTARNCGVLLGDAEERLSLAACPEAAAAPLQCEKGETVMRIRGVMQSIDGVPVRWRDAYCVTQDIYYSVPLARRV